MKKIFVLAIMAMFTLVSQAQIVSSRSSRVTTTTTQGLYEDYNTIYLQWNPSSLVPKEGDSYSFTGFSAGYNHAFSVSQNIPLYVEAGIGIQYSFWSGDTYFPYKMGERNYEEKIKDCKIKLLSAKVPLSIAYKFEIPNSFISIIPNAGIDLRFNFLAKLNNDNWKESINLFDEDLSYLINEGGYDFKLRETWKRFQVGWHVGVNVMFNNTFMIGGSYGTDFTTIWNYFDCKMRTGSITLGYCF